GDAARDGGGQGAREPVVGRAHARDHAPAARLPPEAPARGRRGALRRRLRRAGDGGRRGPGPGRDRTGDGGTAGRVGPADPRRPMSDPLAERVLAYLREHRVMTLATRGDHGPWAAAVF